MRAHRLEAEVFAPFEQREPIPPTESLRSTWLSASVSTLRKAGLLDTYLEHLPEEFHDPVLNTVAGMWLPVEVAIAHYDACDALGLTPARQLEIGKQVSNASQRIILDTAFRLAKGAGVTPWTILQRYPLLWKRVFDGGGVAVYKLGPKEARIVFAGVSCGHSTYFRVGLQGVVQNMNTRFCRQGYVKGMPSGADPTRIVLRYSWV